MWLLVRFLAMDGSALEWKATLLAVWEKGPGGNGGGAASPGHGGPPCMKAGDDRGGPGRGGVMQRGEHGASWIDIQTRPPEQRPPGRWQGSQKTHALGPSF